MSENPSESWEHLEILIQFVVGIAQTLRNHWQWLIDGLQLLEFNLYISLDLHFVAERREMNAMNMKEMKIMTMEKKMKMQYHLSVHSLINSFTAQWTLEDLKKSQESPAPNESFNNVTQESWKLLLINTVTFLSSIPPMALSFDSKQHRMKLMSKLIRGLG